MRNSPFGSFDPMHAKLVSAKATFVAALLGLVLSSLCLIDPAPATGSASFAGPITFGAGGNDPQAVAAADFDRDGNTDFAVANYWSGDVSILLGDKLGNFVLSGTVPLGTSGQGAIAIATADFNNDGWTDLVIASELSDKLCVLINNTGSAGFGPPLTLPPFGALHSVTAADFNRDGMTDIAALGQLAGNGIVTVFLGVRGGFSRIAQPVTLASGSPYSIDTADFNRDGKTDIAAAPVASSRVAVCLGDGDGTFAPSRALAVGAYYPHTAVAVDLNADGCVDLATANRNAHNLSVLLGDGTGDFLAPRLFSSPVLYPTFISTGDLNNDGFPDLAVTNHVEGGSFFGMASFVLGDGAGGFQSNPWYATLGTSAVGDNAIRDVNHDGRLDIATVCGAPTNVVSLLLNTSAINSSLRLDAPQTIGLSATPGSEPKAIAAADLNNDGVMDLIVANEGSSNLTTLLGQRSGGYTRRGTFGIGSGAERPVSLATGDFDRDGRIDAATSNYQTSNVSVLRGNGSGDLAVVGSRVAVGAQPTAIATTDFDCDGKLDLATANNEGRSVSVLAGNGACGFSPWNRPYSKPHRDFPTHYYPHDLVAADLNRDGRKDIVAAQEDANASVLLQMTDESFARTEPFAGGTEGPGMLTSGDFNNDGYDDVAVADGGSDSVSLLLGLGTGAFEQPRRFWVAGRGQSGITSCDFNNNGSLDLAVSSTSGDVSVLRGDGAGSFAFHDQASVNGGPAAVVAAQLNPDAKCDLATANRDGNSVSLLFSDVTSPTTSLSVDPPEPDGENGWYRNSPIASMRPNEPCVAFYQWDATATAGWRQDPYIPAPEGVHTLYWFSVDRAENTETVRSRTFKVDTQPPAGMMLINDGADFTTSQLVNAHSAVTGAAKMRFNFNIGAAWSSWFSYASNKSLMLPAGDGFKAVSAEYKDAAGNVLPASDTIFLDTAPPTGMMTILDGAAVTSSRYVWARSDMGELCEARFDSGAGWTEWRPCQLIFPIVLTDGDGEKTVQAQYRDAAGNVLSLSDSIILDTTGPTAKMAIDQDADYTTTLTVTAYCESNDAAQMRFDANGTWTAWESFDGTKTLTLSAGDGEKTVYAEFKDAAENTTSASDSITLDTIPPSGHMEINGAATETNSNWVWVTSDVGDAVLMRFNPGGGWTDWQPYSPDAVCLDLPDSDGEKGVQGQYRDAAGNVLALTGSIVLDTTPPSGTIVVNNGRIGTRSTTIPVALQVTGGNRMRFYVADHWTGWQGFSGATTLTLPAGDGDKFIWAEVADAAGNVLGGGGGVVLDTTPPDVEALIIEDGRAYTRSRGVHVNSDIRESPTQMRFTVGSGWTPWQTGDIDACVTLPSGDGTKTVRGEYRDWVGNTRLLSDTIVLDMVDPARPGSFRAAGRDPGDDRICLSWTNPPDSGFSHELIFVSMSGFARLPEDQLLLCNTRRTSIDDTGSAWAEGDFRRGTRYYYTMFAFDRAGNRSTAATATALMRHRTQLSADGPFPWSGWKASCGETATISGEMFLPDVKDAGGLPTEVRRRRDIFLWRRQYAETTWSRASAATFNSTYDWYEARAAVMRTTLFQFRFSGDTTYAASMSPAVTVGVHAYLSQPWTAPTTIYRARYFTVYGYLKPRHAGTTRIDFYRYVYGGWRYYRHLHATNYDYGTLTRYRLSCRLFYRGRWYIKASHADSCHLATQSAARFVTVR